MAKQRPPQRSLKAHRQHPASISGSGSITFDGLLGAPGGIVARDATPDGFSARIQPLGFLPDTPTNAYGFAEVNDADPEFGILPGGRFGDGVQVAAYETSGNLDVPADGSVVVFLTPLLSRPGYKFTYAAPPAISTGGTALNDTGAEDDWTAVAEYPLELPAAGTYLLTGQATGYALATLSDGAYLLLQAGLFVDDVLASAPVHVAQAVVSGVTAYGTAPLQVVLTVGGPKSVVCKIRLRSDGAVTGAAGGLSIAHFENVASNLTYLKIG